MLATQFNLKTAICINKADINAEMSDQIAHEAERLGVAVLGRIRYDDAVTRAQIKRLAVVEDGDSLAAEDIRVLWENVQTAMPLKAG